MEPCEKISCDSINIQNDHGKVNIMQVHIRKENKTQMCTNFICVNTPLNIPTKNAFGIRKGQIVYIQINEKLEISRDFPQFSYPLTSYDSGFINVT